MSTKVFRLIFSEAVTNYNGTAARIGKVRVADPRIAFERQSTLARKLNRRFAGHARFVLDGTADSLLFVGKSAEIPFLGLAESNYGGNAFVNLDRKASDELLFEVASHETGHLLGMLHHDGAGLAACAYTGGETVTLNSGDSITGEAIADEASYTVVEPYAKTLTVNDGASVSSTGIYKGGTITVAAATAALDGITVSGGNLTVNAGATINNLTFLSGTITITAKATFNNAAIAGTVTLGSASIVNGATITAGRLTVAGAGGVAKNINTTIAKGFGWGSGVYVAGTDTNIVLGGISNETGIKIENGVLTGLNIATAVRGIGDGITVRDFTLTGNGQLLISGTGVKISGGTVTNGTVKVTGGEAVFFGGLNIAGGAVSAYNGSIVSGAVMTGGALTIAGNGSAVASNINITGTGKLTMGKGTYLAGADTNIVLGGFAAYADAKVENGVWTGLSYDNGWEVGIGDGITLQDALIGGGVSSNSLIVSGSGINVSGGTLASKSFLRISAADNVLINGLTVSGTVYASNGGVVFDNMQLAGGTVYATGDESFTGLHVTVGTVSATGGNRFVDLEMTGGIVSAYGGGIVSGATVTGTGNLRIAGAGGVGSDLKVSDGGTVTWGNNVYLAGAATEIAYGAITNHGTVKVENGVMTGLALTDNGLTRGIGDGLTVSDAVIGDGTNFATLAISGTDVKVSGGTVMAKSYINVLKGEDVLINGLTVSGVVVASDGEATFDNLNVAGGTVSATGGETFTNLELTAGTVSATGASLISGATVNGGAISALGGATFRALEITGGKVSAYGGGQVYGATITGGSMAVAGAGGIASGVNLTGTGKLTMGRSTYIAGSNTNIIQGGLVGLDTLKVENGVMTGLSFYNGKDFGIGDGITIQDAVIGNAVSSNSLIVSGADINISGGTLMSKSFLRIFDAENVLVNGLTVSGGIFASNGGVTFDNLKVTGGTVSATGGEHFINIDIAAGTAVITGEGASVSGAMISGGTMNIQQGGSVSGVVVSGGSAEFLDPASMTGVERPAIIAEDVSLYEGRANFRGTNVSGANLTVYGGKAYVTNGATLNGLVVSGGSAIVTFYTATTLVDYNTHGGTVYNAEVYDGMLEIGSDAIASGVSVNGGTLYATSGATVSAASLASNGRLIIYGGLTELDSVASGARIDIAGSAAKVGAVIGDWGNFSADAEVHVYNADPGYSYNIATAANSNVTLDCGGYRIFKHFVKSGKQYSNAFVGHNYDFSDGKTLITSSFSVDVAVVAAALGTGTATALADGGFAAIWTADTDTSSVSVVADANTTGDAWVTVNGATLATPLYGAQGNFAHDVNMWIYEGTVRNLAAGATAGGSVENVNLLISDNGEGTDKLTFSGTAYLGGFGSVAGEVTAAVYGGTYDKDFYAGALANKLATNTSVGGVNLTVTGGKFKGNLYGASAVKTVDGTGAGIRNTTGDVNLTIAGGEADKSDFCAFAGGYATGTATGTVYTVDSVSATISGGTWGEAKGGRGIFGGIMASQVSAQVLGEVNLTVSGGTMGNVYGGGWAQKNGSSTVGNVNINITGGTVTNVFGGGSHSTSGGSTTAGDVTITVSGGDITGAIYARGQLDGDTTGAANVIFTGATDFTCDVFGYSYVGGEASDATLSFSGYTGTLSGNVGGFNGIKFNDGSAATFAAAADIGNGKWEFDLTARAEALAGTSLLTWTAESAFSGDTVKVAFADAAQAAAGWSIATAAFDATTTFDLYIGGDKIAEGIAYDTAISGGDWDGWKFTSVDGTLKFANLA